MVLSRFVKAASLYSIGTFAPAVVNFLLLPVFAIYLSPDEFGSYEIYVMISTLVVAVSRLGLPGSITRFYIDFVTEDAKRSFIKTILISTFIFSILFSLLTYVLFWIFYDTSGTQYNFLYLLILTLSGVCFKSFYEVLVKVYQITENVKKITIFTLLLFSVNAVVKMFLIIGLGYGFEALVYAELLTNAVSLLLGVYYLKHCLSSRFSVANFKDSILYGFPVSIHHLSTWVVAYSSSLMVAYFYDEYLLGIYSIAIKLFIPATFVIDAMANAYSPVYYKLRKSGHRVSVEVGQLNSLFINTSLVLCSAMIWATKLCVYYLFNEQYLPILDFISIICLSLFFNAAYRIKVAEVFYLKRTSIVPKVTLITGLVGLISGFFLISNFGLIGGGISVLLSSIFQYCIVSIYSRDFKVLSVEATSWALLVVLWLAVLAEISAVNVFSINILVVALFQFFVSALCLGYFMVTSSFWRQKEHE